MTCIAFVVAKKLLVAAQSFFNVAEGLYAQNPLSMTGARAAEVACPALSPSHFHIIILMLYIIIAFRELLYGKHFICCAGQAKP